MSEWISVKDRLPEDGVAALLYVENPYGPKDYFIGYLSVDGYSWVETAETAPMTLCGHIIEGCGSLRKVTHWMPLPEPPKGEDEDENEDEDEEDDDERE